MTRLLVERPDGTRVATVLPEGKKNYRIDTLDENVRNIINSVLDQAEQQGITYRFYRRAKTESGLKYESLGRRLKPGETDFLQALGDYLINYELVAYPEEEDDSF